MSTEFLTGDECLVHEVCRNYPAQCLGCYFPEDALGPTQYIPRDKKIEHPLTVERKEDRATRRKQAKRSDASKRGKRSSRKGADGERELAKKVGGMRVPLSGAMGGNLSNDVVFPDGLQAEVKRRGPDAFKLLYRWVLDERERPDLVAIRADNQPWLVVQTLDQWQASRQASPVNLKKLGEAMRLLEEAIR